MDDAMVTGRMSAEKKAAGARVLEKAGLKILSSDLEMVPENYVTPEESAIPKILNLIDRLEENDDVQNVFHNAILPEEEEED